MERPIKYVVEAMKWFDKVNGNTYCASRIVRTRDGAVLRCPFEYGYGDYYRQAALQKMAEAEWLPSKYREELPSGGLNVYCYEQENNYPILWIVNHGKKRDVVALGQE